MVRLSIIIPTYNEESYIHDCISSLYSQTYKDFEIIVVDDGSKDKTREIVKEFDKVKLLKGKHKGPGASRNLGSKKARGEILVFVDADMTFDKNYLTLLIRPIIENKAIGTENEVQISSNFDSNMWSRCWGKFFFDGKNKNRKIFRAIRKKDFFRMGGFDSKYGYGDDQTFFLKFGVRPVIAKGAICYHKGPKSFKEVYSQSKWIASSVQSKIFEIKMIKYFSFIIFVLFSPLAWIVYSLYKIYKNKDMKIIFWIFIFSLSRISGMVAGVFSKVFRGQNVR
jgi:glycosyltransferase involved in cell wall biosynthesis